MQSNQPHSGIILMGLGPGNPELLTRQAWHVLESISELYLRTRQHPVVASLPNSLQVYSFDSIYEQEDNYGAVYEGIVEKVLELGNRPQGVVYAVPGHPFIAEITCPEIARRARQMKIPLKVVEGLSFIEPCLAALELDPFPQTVLVDALELATAHVPSFPPGIPAIIAQIHSKEVASNVKLTLMSLYPDDHMVRLVHAAGTDTQRVEDVKLYEIDRSQHIGLLSALYVPPLEKSSSFEAFLEVVTRLRAPDGCPWDREQTHASLRPFLLEETYELLSALDSGDIQAMREELGDLLLQILLHTQIASEEGEFSIIDVLTNIHTKIVNRHPHVFGELKLKESQEVLLNWERLKDAERAANGKGIASLLDSIPLSLPALSQADQYQRRAARIGFDWQEVHGVLEKVKEEIEELRRAGAEEREFELGDLLFSLVNVARWYGIDAESALRQANARFRERFTMIEQAARQQGRALSDMSLEEMDALWQEAKMGHSETL